MGCAGLQPTCAAIRAGKDICLANKETLIAGGPYVLPLARKHGVAILPADSEHSAIYQCLVGEPPESIQRIILTASGGPFRKTPASEFHTITRERALKHPKWVMGPKITIDSATLMNKGLEVIEARWLFQQPLEKIDVVVHPQSIVHSFVEFTDGSMKAQLGMPDMRLPIQYALAAPERLAESYDRLDLLTCGPLEFEAPDLDRFPALSLARSASERGGLFPTILNAANEVGVAAFLDGKLSFTGIPSLISATLDSFDRSFGAPFTLSSDQDIEAGLTRIFEADRSARERATALLASGTFAA